MATATTNQVVVYRVRNLIDGKHYIGVTRRGLGRREHEHRYDAKQARSNSLLHRAMRKYGAENFVFEVVYDFDGDYELAMIYEAELVEKENPAYNLVPGGLNKVGPVHPETRARMRESHLGIPNAMKGKKRPPDYVHPRKGKKASPETLARMRAYAEKRWPPKPEPTAEEKAARQAEALRRKREARKGLPGAFTGHKHTPETIEKIAAAHRGKPGYWKGKKRPEVGEKISAALKGRPSWNIGKTMPPEAVAKMAATKKGKTPRQTEAVLAAREINYAKMIASKRIPVVCLDDGRDFDSAAAADSYYGLPKGSVSQVTSGRLKTTHGRRFAYKVAT